FLYATTRPRPSPPLFPYTTLFRSVVSAGRLRAALEHVAGGDRAREPVPVVAGPAEMGRRRPDHERRVGDAARDHHVRAAIERLRSEEHTSELQSLTNLVCRLLLEK